MPSYFILNMNVPMKRQVHIIQWARSCSGTKWSTCPMTNPYGKARIFSGVSEGPLFSKDYATTQVYKNKCRQLLFGPGYLGDGVVFENKGLNLRTSVRPWDRDDGVLASTGCETHGFSVFCHWQVDAGEESSKVNCPDCPSQLLLVSY